MPLDTQTVGANQRSIVVVGDPSQASQLQSVLSLADAQSLSGKYVAVIGGVPWLLNASGLFDQQRSAIGTTGVAAVSTESSKTCYSVGYSAFTPAATATDIWQVVGSATKTVRVLRIAISGVATAAIAINLELIRRSTATTGATPTALTVSQHDSNDAAPTALVNALTVNGTLGSTGGVLRSQRLNLGAVGAAGIVGAPLIWDFSTRNSKGIVLRGVAQQVALSWGGAAIPSGTLLCIDCEFSEE